MQVEWRGGLFKAQRIALLDILRDKESEIHMITFPPEHSSTALLRRWAHRSTHVALPCRGAGFKDVPRMSALWDYSLPAFPTI